MTIWKYELMIMEDQTLVMPKGATILSVDNQNGGLCLWAMVDPDEPYTDRRIEIIGTGAGIDTTINRKFIGTVVLIGSFVWHVFEKIKD